MNRGAGLFVAATVSLAVSPFAGITAALMTAAIALRLLLMTAAAMTSTTFFRQTGTCYGK